MPPRRRPPHRARRRPAPRGADPALEAALESAARRLAAAHSLEDLESLLEQVKARAEAADQRACQEPGPEALRAYRAAEQEVAEILRAIEVAEAAGTV